MYGFDGLIMRPGTVRIRETPPKPRPGCTLPKELQQISSSFAYFWGIEGMLAVGHGDFKKDALSFCFSAPRIPE
jgi:hypothetical protein